MLSITANALRVSSIYETAGEMRDRLEFKRRSRIATTVKACLRARSPVLCVRAESRRRRTRDACQCDKGRRAEQCVCAASRETRGRPDRGQHSHSRRHRRKELRVSRHRRLQRLRRNRADVQACGLPWPTEQCSGDCRPVRTCDRLAWSGRGHRPEKTRVEREPGIEANNGA
jgi:hypothetical protein